MAFDLSATSTQAPPGADERTSGHPRSRIDEDTAQFGRTGRTAHHALTAGRSFNYIKAMTTAKTGFAVCPGHLSCATKQQSDFETTHFAPRLRISGASRHMARSRHLQPHTARAAGLRASRNRGKGAAAGQSRRRLRSRADRGPELLHPARGGGRLRRMPRHEPPARPNLGILLAPVMNVANYGSFGRYVIGADTLGQSIERSIAALCYHSTDDRMSVAIVGDEARYSYGFALAGRTGYGIIACAAAGVLLSVFRAYLPADWRPLRVELDTDKPRQAGVPRRRVPMPSPFQRVRGDRCHGAPSSICCSEARRTADRHHRGCGARSAGRRSTRSARRRRGADPCPGSHRQRVDR